MDAEPLRQLADVDLPLPPDWTPWLLAMAGAVLLVVIVAWAALRRTQRLRQAGAQPLPAASPEQELERLLIEWQRDEIASREVAYRLATLLRLALRVPRLDPQPPDCIASHREQWPEFVRDLATLRYQSAADRTLRPEWLPLIRNWLQESHARP